MTQDSQLPVIFLDIDGVLNTRHHLKRQYREKGRGNVTGRDWCPVACRHVELLCRQFGARIVVSSTWRYNHDLEELRAFFSDNDIPPELVIDTTPALIDEEGPVIRGDEIKRWLQEYETPVHTYAIIDDMPASGFLEEQQPHLVSVQEEMGFAVKELAIRAGEILSRG